METLGWTALGISAALTLACWIHLWRGRDGAVSKIVWTLLSAFPMLGPLLYAGVHDAPPVQPEVDRAAGRGDWDAAPDDGPHR